jgi:hypothetical protein
MQYNSGIEIHGVLGFDDPERECHRIGTRTLYWRRSRSDIIIHQQESEWGNPKVSYLKFIRK